MVVISARSVAVARSFIVPVPGPMIVVMVVIVVVRRVLLAGMTTLGVGVSHARLLSKWCARNGYCRGGSNVRRRCRRLGLLGR